MKTRYPSQAKFHLVIGAGLGEGWRLSETESIPCLFLQPYRGCGCAAELCSSDRFMLPLPGSGCSMSCVAFPALPAETFTVKPWN